MADEWRCCVRIGEQRWKANKTEPESYCFDLYGHFYYDLAYFLVCY